MICLKAYTIYFVFD